MREIIDIMKSKETHLREVEKLQAILGQQNQKITLKNNSASNTLRNGAYKKESIQLDMSNLKKVLELNLEEKWILVEPRITFRELCQFTEPYNLIPPVVPEFTSITVGGAIMGAALESSSHRFGQVNDCCLEYECLLGNGELITASETKNKDLFYACAGSYGTLALLTAIKMRLIDSKKWVRLTYHRFGEVKKAVEMLTRPHQSDFVEGIVFDRSHSVVITGDMAPHPKRDIIRQNHAWSCWYVSQVCQTNKTEEYMPIKEYLFRLDRGAFWIGSYAHSFRAILQLLFHLRIPKIKKHGFNPNLFFRLLFGWAFSSKKLYQFWHRVSNALAETLFFIHDFYAPFSQANTVLESFMEETAIFPIWLCPIKGTDTPQFLSPHFGGSNFLNIGLYGVPQNNLSIPQLSAWAERVILSFGGRKMLYSFTYYDHETFSKVYFETLYKTIRKKFSADRAFPSLYNKITKMAE
jgi:Delta24-sterol reductase